ncbi:MAG: DoxX family protein [Alcanivoracaceae bacterium]
MNNPDVGKLILRIALGFMMLLHGINKLFHGISAISGMLVAHGLPGWLAFGVFIGEIVAPLMVLLGLQTRVGAGLMVINMLFAIFLAHSHQIFTLTSHGGWGIELQAFYLFTAAALVFLGGGRYVIKN